MTGEQITDDLELLLDVMPPRLRQVIEPRPDKASLVEIVLDLGRLPEVRYPDRGETVSEEPVSHDDIAWVVARVGRFGKDNRAGIERTLHRVSAIRNRVGDVIGLTCRVGRAVFGTVDILRDVIESGKSMLLLGRPGVGKTTLLREAARVLADELSKRVIVVDTSNEIAGDGDIPHPGIGRARRMQVPSPDEQHGVMIEAVENHMPQVIVIDEIGTAAEALAARTIAERGVQLVATAHGNTLDNLLQNPTLSDLVGGIHAVTLSDEEARRRGTQKTVLERKAPPTFDVLIEIQDKDRLAVHDDVAEVVDRFLRDVPPRPELRTRTAEGGVEIRKSERQEMKKPETPWGDPQRPSSSRRGPQGPGRNGGRKRARPADPAPWELGPPPPAPPIRAAVPEVTTEPEAAVARKAARGKTVRVYPYAVSKDKLERALRKLRVPVVLVEDLDEADLVVSLKAQERRQPRRLRDAAAKNVPVQIIKSNTIAQMENFLRAFFGLGDGDVTADDEAALRDVEDAVDAVLGQGNPVELPPRNNHLRRLQHQIVERYGLTSSSKGEEPYRRVVVYPG